MTIFLLLSREGEAQPNYIFNKLSNKDGLSHNTVFDIAQDSLGVVWIATKQGLNRYNGHDIKKYYQENFPELPSNIINVLHITRRGELYIGTENGLVRYDFKFDKFIPVQYHGKNISGIISLLETNNNLIIIGTKRGCFQYDPENENITEFIGLQNETINSMLLAAEETIMLGTYSGILIIDTQGNILDRINVKNTPTLASNLISCLYYSDDTSIWVGTENAGLFHFNKKDKVFDLIRLSEQKVKGSEFVRGICDDRHGNIWVGTETGIYIYNESLGKVQHIQHSLEESESNLSDNAVYCLFRSREDIMWLGTYFGGINYTFLQNRKGFYHIYPGNDENELRGKAVNKIFKSSKGIIWLATEDGGVCTMNPRNKEILGNFQSGNNSNLSSNNIHSICEDRDGNIWLGHYTTGIDIYDPVKDSFRNILPNPEHSDQITYNSIYSIFKDSRGNIWVGTRENVLLYDYESQTFTRFMPQRLENVFTYHILEDRKGRIWFGTRFNGVFCFDPNTGDLEHFSRSTGTGRGLGSDQVISGMEDSQGRIWFGTNDEGVSIYIPEKDSFEVINSLKGLPNNTIYGMLEDPDGNMWLSSNMGITRYNYTSGECKNFSLSHGLSQMQFNYNSYFQDEDGTMYFGNVGGLTYFNPLQLENYTHRPTVEFVDFKLFNNSIPIMEKGLLKQHINHSDKISLKYIQKVFTIDFMAIDFFSGGQNNYQYYLDGFEDDWNEPVSRNNVTYTNLLPGKYTFYLRAFGVDGAESRNIKTLQIRVLRPWWLSNPALIAYLLVLILVLRFYRRSAILREQQKAALHLEKVEKERIQELNQQRLNFFTYISHEFKTPLTIIIASIEEFFELNQLPEKLKDSLAPIRKSAKRLEFLINQLMDFRKIETKHARLVLQKGDMVLFLKETCQAFEPVFTRKEVPFEFQSSHESYICWFDPDKLEKILTNLLSNAIKYTSFRGKVACLLDFKLSDSVTNSPERLEIRVSDTGAGISEADLKILFLPFHSHYRYNEEKIGTGIGLTLVRSLVEYLGGSIDVKTKKGEGTEFLVSLPLQMERIADLKIENEDRLITRSLDIEHLSYPDDSLNIVTPDEHAQDCYHILIVEDTLDLAEVLINHFSKNYRVSFAGNGREAFELVKNEEPDLIISDIMMPEMNGIDFCRKIKADKETSHIAVILLTAKTSQEDRLEGLEAGAEAFVTKPFDFRELDLHVKNFLEVRKTLQTNLLSQKDFDLSQVKMHSRDKDFIEKSRKIIIQNIENESFTVEDLSRELAMSKTLVYLKHKKLLNISAKEFMQILRFRQAIEYMITTDYNMSEIANKVGFSDPNYFSRAFRKVYQTSPTRYREQLLINNGGRD